MWKRLWVQDIERTNEISKKLEKRIAAAVTTRQRYFGSDINTGWRKNS